MIWGDGPQIFFPRTAHCKRPIVGVIFLWNTIPAHFMAKWFLFVSSELCAVGLRVKTCWLHNMNLVETLRLVKYLWTEIQNLDGILDGIGDFGRTENEILHSMFVQSLRIHCCKRPKYDFCISQGSVATVLRWADGQNYGRSCHVSSWCCVPKIIKVNQCFRELVTK